MKGSTNSNRRLNSLVAILKLIVMCRTVVTIKKDGIIVGQIDLSDAELNETVSYAINKSAFGVYTISTTENDEYETCVISKPGEYIVPINNYMLFSSPTSFTVQPGDRSTSLANDGLLEWSNDAQN